MNIRALCVLLMAALVAVAVMPRGVVCGAKIVRATNFQNPKELLKRAKNGLIVFRPDPALGVDDQFDAMMAARAADMPADEEWTFVLATAIPAMHTTYVSESGKRSTPKAYMGDLADPDEFGEWSHKCAVAVDEAIAAPPTGAPPPLTQTEIVSRAKAQAQAAKYGMKLEV
jgi:hypothetical protein